MRNDFIAKFPQIAHERMNTGNNDETRSIPSPTGRAGWGEGAAQSFIPISICN